MATTIPGRARANEKLNTCCAGLSDYGQPALKIALLGEASHVNCQRWVEGLSKAGAHVHQLSFHVGNHDQDHVSILPASSITTKLQYITTARYVRRMLDQIQPDVVIAYYVTGYGTLGVLAGYHPLVLVTSGSDVLLAPRNIFMRRLLRFNISRADLVTAWAPHMADAARKLGATEDRLMVLPRGIPSDSFTSLKCGALSEFRPVRLIATRSLKLDYNTDHLLQACRKLKDMGVEFNLTIAGDGPQRTQLEKRSDELDLQGHIHFAGFVSNESLPALLAEHNLYISLIESDGVSASLLEAMAVGLLPIVPDNQANRHWIKSGENGLLLQDQSTNAVVNGVLDGIANRPLRERAWEQNPTLVSSQADLYRNASVFVERFKELARVDRKTNGKRGMTEVLH